MAIVLTIAGADKTALLVATSLAVSDELNARNTCAFTLDDPAGTYRPAIGAVVTVVDGGTTYFAGTIEEVQEVAWAGGTTQTLTVTCVDYTQLCDRHLVAREFTSQTLVQIVTDLVTLALPGEGITYSATGTPVVTIDKAIFNYQTVAECLNELTDLVACSWYVDYSKVLRVIARTTNLAAFNITDGSPQFLADSLTMTKTRGQYRNRQYVRAGQDLTSSRVESFKGDGTRKAFTLNFPVAKVPTVTVNAVSKTVGIRGVDTGKDWYWNGGDPIMSQDDGAAALTTSDTLAVTYQGFFPIIVQSQSEKEIADRKTVEGGTGLYETIADEPTINTDDLANAKAAGLLRRYGVIPTVLTYQTDTGGLKAGQLQTVTLTRYGISAAEYLLEKVDLRDLDGTDLRYTVTALSGEALGGWHEFFRKLVKGGRKFVIRDNEVLLLLRATSEAVALTDAMTPTTGTRESRVGTALVGYSEAA